MLFKRIFLIASIGSLPLYVQAQIKAVIYDLNGVLLKMNTLGIASEIGLGDALFYLGDVKNSAGWESRLYQVLEEIDGKQTEAIHVVCGTHGQRMPRILCRWMDGTFNPVAERVGIMRKLEELRKKNFFKNRREYRVLKRNIELMLFEPRALNKHKKRIKKMLTMAHDIKCAGVCVQLVLSNIDHLTYKDMLTTPAGRDLTAVIPKENIVVSAAIGYNKPHPKSYQYVLTRLAQQGIMPHECLFIDDQLENVKGAQNVGMQALHVKNKNYKEIRKQLQRLGALY